MQQHNPTDAPQTAPSNEQPSLFEDMADTSAYEKPLRNARIWLYVVAGLHVLMAVVNYFQLKDADESIAAFTAGIYVVIAAIFFGLALWSRRKASTAFLVAVILYIAFIIGFSILEPENLVRGLLMRILVIVALIRGYQNAKNVEQIKASFGSSN